MDMNRNKKGKARTPSGTVFDRKVDEIKSYFISKNLTDTSDLNSHPTVNYAIKGASRSANHTSKQTGSDLSTLSEAIKERESDTFSMDQVEQSGSLRSQKEDSEKCEC